MRALLLLLLLSVVVAGCAAPETVRNSPTAPSAGNEAPVARIAAIPAEGVGGQEVRFDASASHDRDGRIVRYRWDFGDGSAAVEGVQVAVSHTFAEPGSYTVTLTVSDNGTPPATGRASAAYGVSMMREVQGAVAAATPEGAPAEVSTTWFVVKPGATVLRWEASATPTGVEPARVTARLVSASGEEVWAEAIDVPAEGATLSGGLQGKDLAWGAWHLEVQAAQGAAAIAGTVLVAYGVPSS